MRRVLAAAAALAIALSAEKDDLPLRALSRRPNKFRHDFIAKKRRISGILVRGSPEASSNSAAMSSASRLSQLEARISSIEKSRGCFIERIPFRGVARRLPFITDFKFVPADPDPLALSKYQLGAGHEDEKKPSEVMRVSDEQARSTIPDA